MSNDHQWENDEPLSDQEYYSSISFEEESVKNKNFISKQYINQESEKKIEQTKKEEKNSLKNRKSENSTNPQITLSLSGSKFVFSSGKWIDITDKNEVSSIMHPLVAENMNLKRRYELLLSLLAESDFEIQQNQKELEDVEGVISQLKEILMKME